MSDQQTHAARWQRHRQPRAALREIEDMVADDPMRDEHRRARWADDTPQVRVGGTWRDADEVPDLADVVDLP